MTPGRSTVTVAAAALALVLALALIGCGGGSSSGSGEKTGGAIEGAGATAPQPLYEQWTKRFKARTGTTVNYAPVGSGDGIAQFVAGTADFGATDVAMNAAELRAAAKKGRPVQVPAALGAVAVAYRVPGLGPGLRLDGPRWPACSWAGSAAGTTPASGRSIPAGGSRASGSRWSIAGTIRGRPSSSPRSSAPRAPSGRGGWAAPRRWRGRSAPPRPGTQASRTR